MWCGKVFIAHKMSTSYCSHKCASAAYKDRVRKERVAAYQKEQSIQELNEPIKDLEQKEFFTPTEAGMLLGISRASIYRYMADSRQYNKSRSVQRKDTYQKKRHRYLI